MDDDIMSQVSDSISIDWTDDDDDDELEINGTPLSSCVDRGGASTSTSVNLQSTTISGTSSSKMIKYFLAMGFPEHLVIKALKEFDGHSSEEDIFDTILTYSVLEDPSPSTEPILVNSDDSEMNFTDSEFDLSDDENSINEESAGSSEEVTPLSLLIEMGYGAEEALTAIQKSGKESPIEELIQFIYATQCCDGADAPPQGHPPESTVNHLTRETAGPSGGNGSLIAALLEMGYKHDEASAAVDRCGSDTPIAELIDFIDAARFCGDGDTFEQEQSSVSLIDCAMKRKKICFIPHNNKKKMKQMAKRKNVYEDETTHLPNPMIGFGVPSMQLPGCRRMDLPEIAAGPPYFYYENVALTPKGVWQTIKRSLYDIKPEFVDSKYFNAANRKRGYVHNLPIQNRFQLTPIPPATIHEAFPHSKEWWPSWDTRKKLNCLVTCIGSAKLTNRIKNAIEKHSKGDKEPPAVVKKYVMYHCKKWNMIWVGKNKVAHLEPHEMEELMGFPNGHTRGYSTTDRHKFLGNSFQIDTVAYHLSVLKKLYPGGINVLSLFSGIGGAEVALHRLGIPMKNVVSVEISERCREILQSWWQQTEQKGNLIHEVHDVKEVNRHMLGKWISELGCFELVIGGSPCNNLAGGNRRSRVGLEGEHSSMFFHYVRILQDVRSIMRN